LLQLGQRGHDRALDLLQPAWDPHGPRTVAEIPLHLTADARDREPDERRLRVEPVVVGRIDQAQVGDLLQIIGLGTTSAEPAGDPARNLDVELDDLIDQRLPLGLVGRSLPASQQFLGGGFTRGPLFGRRALRRYCLVGLTRKHD
jgi:hypothetical protein